ncbi:Hypothetical predicted protein [Octopus vulgaris]|uniref:Uncharacterized protein n=1 Tax=Octopus vulgaris TaxID=6645 RepID=A0AA36F6U4_OCTVU|nr:Hypothetical predicted protein [Octopus vulgaris]
MEVTNEKPETILNSARLRLVKIFTKRLLNMSRVAIARYKQGKEDKNICFISTLFLQYTCLDISRIGNSADETEKEAKANGYTSKK